MEQQQVITLRGSTDIVKEFFEYSVNSIIYQRGVYPPESFRRIPKYGLSMMVTTDDALIQYIANIMNQLQGIDSIIIALLRLLYFNSINNHTQNYISLRLARWWSSSKINSGNKGDRIQGNSREMGI